MKEVLRAFKSLSDETRLRVISLILERECCVCEVMQTLNISQSKASRNLSALYDAGFLKLRKEGLWSYYSVDNELKDYQLDMVKAVKKALKNSKITVLDRARLRELKRDGLAGIRDSGEKSLCSDKASA
jgi:ArsR family transcriptional regulator